MSKIKEYFLSVVCYWPYLIVLVLIVLASFFWYRNDQIEKQKSEAIKMEEGIKEEQKEKELKLILDPICQVAVKDITAVRFFRCKEYKLYGLLFASLIDDVKTWLDSPNLPAFCQRKVGELTVNEFIECLEEKNP